jgi:hypothetical protein
LVLSIEKKFHDQKNRFRYITVVLKRLKELVLIYDPCTVLKWPPFCPPPFCPSPFFVACKVPGSRSLPREPQQTLNKNKPSTTVSKSVACTTSFANPPSLRFLLSKELCWTSDQKKTTTTKRQLTFWRVFWREKVHSGQAGFVLH